VAGSSCGALLPTGRATDVIDGIESTCIDNGMPVVVLRAHDFGLTGAETPAELEADAKLKTRVERIRLEAGALMRLGDVTRKTVPKMTLIASPRAGGAIATRTFIPHRVHEAIGVLGAVSVATACVLPGTVTAGIAETGQGAGSHRVAVEHPTGAFIVDIEVESVQGDLRVRRSALLRTARKLMQGQVYVPC
jgi:4-oxalomesaconate tautomerase